MIGDIRGSFGEEPEWAEGDEQEEYLDRIGVEEEGVHLTPGVTTREVDITEFRPRGETVIDLESEPWIAHAVDNTIVRNTGARIMNLEAANIETPNLMIGDATFSATDIDHPVVDRIQDKIDRLEEKVEMLLRENTKQDEVNQSIYDALKRHNGEK